MLKLNMAADRLREKAVENLVKKITEAVESNPDKHVYTYKFTEHVTISSVKAVKDGLEREKFQVDIKSYCNGSCSSDWGCSCQEPSYVLEVRW